MLARTTSLSCSLPSHRHPTGAATQTVFHSSRPSLTSSCTHFLSKEGAAAPASCTMNEWWVFISSTRTNEASRTYSMIAECSLLHSFTEQRDVHEATKIERCCSLPRHSQPTFSLNSSLTKFRKAVPRTIRLLASELFEQFHCVDALVHRPDCTLLRRRLKHALLRVLSEGHCGKQFRVQIAVPTSGGNEHTCTHLHSIFVLARALPVGRGAHARPSGLDHRLQHVLVLVQLHSWY